MWFSSILMSQRIILLICQRFCLSPDFTSFIVFDLHNVLYACVAINEAHSLLHCLSVQFLPIYLQMVIWHTWIGNSSWMPKKTLYFLQIHQPFKHTGNACNHIQRLAFHVNAMNANMCLRNLINECCCTKWAASTATCNQVSAWGFQFNLIPNTNSCCNVGFLKIWDFCETVLLYKLLS